MKQFRSILYQIIFIMIEMLKYFHNCIVFDRKYYASRTPHFSSNHIDECKKRIDLIYSNKAEVFMKNIKKANKYLDM